MESSSILLAIGRWHVKNGCNFRRIKDDKNLSNTVFGLHSKTPERNKRISLWYFLCLIGILLFFTTFFNTSVVYNIRLNTIVYLDQAKMHYKYCIFFEAHSIMILIVYSLFYTYINKWFDIYEIICDGPSQNLGPRYRDHALHNSFLLKS